MAITKFVIYLSYYSAAIPFILVPFFYKLWYGNEPITCFQITVTSLLTIHYVKRLYETFFVHRTVCYDLPLIQLLSGIFYYCVLGAGLPEYQVLFTDYTEPNYSIPGVSCMFASLMLFSEYMNLRAHMVLRDLRPPGTTKRGIPYGYGFDWVSCANYMWELCSWVLFACLIQTLFSVLFCIAGLITMYTMALSKHKAYIEYFNGKDREKYPSNRTVMIPLIL